MGHEIPAVGALHGLNALAVCALALYAARGVTMPVRAERAAEETSTATV